MSIINELIRVEKDNLLSFGNYEETTKKKVEGFEVKGDLYKLKTFKDITKLEKNDSLLFEAVPGAAVHNFSLSEEEVSFQIEGFEDTQITLELEPSVIYDIKVQGEDLGKFKSTVSGKLIFSAELSGTPTEIVIYKG